MSSSEQENGADLPVMRGHSGPIATAGLLLGVAAMALFGYWWLDSGSDGGEIKPPSLLALTLSFMALLLGVAALYRVRGMKKQGLVRGASLAALFMGLGGPVLYANQSVHWRAAMQGAELTHLNQIVASCRLYALRHEDQYPPNLAALASSKLINPETLKNPITREADYLYVGAGLKLEYVKPGETRAENPLIVVYSGNTRLGSQRSAAFADGRERMLSPEEFAAAWEANNQARAKLGLPKLTPGEEPPAPATPAATQSGDTPAGTQPASAASAPGK